MGDNLNEAVKNNMVALIVEATEVMNELNWKPWKKPNIIDKTAMQEEIADCLLFIFNAAFEAGLSPADLALIAYNKQNKNMERHPCLA